MAPTQQAFTETAKTSNRTSHTKTQVLMMYKRVVDNVKLRCPGFTRTIENEIYETDANGDDSAFLHTVGEILTQDDRSADSVTKVANGDDLACRIYFPVYDTDYGCKIYDGASVKDAMCYENEQTYDIVILFHEQNTESGISEEFAQMMTPFSEEVLIHNLNAYFPALNKNNCNTALRYYNCEIRCNIDKNSGHLLSLHQKMITQVNMNVNFDLILTESAFSAQTTMINHLDYTDFIWN
ncbi:MAG: hypothetical protein IKB13_03820 [Clostridia bacterium]|nr:hypothetical protein [Clostridia bacterium]